MTDDTARAAVTDDMVEAAQRAFAKAMWEGGDQNDRMRAAIVAAWSSRAPAPDERADARDKLAAHRFYYLLEIDDDEPLEAGEWCQIAIDAVPEIDADREGAR